MRKAVFLVGCVLVVLAAAPGWSAMSAQGLEEMKSRALVGDVASQYWLGYCYEYGKEVPQDSREAVKWYTLAAGNGHLEALQSLGSLYHTGEGVPKDDAKAAQLFYMAARHGHRESQYSLGSLYHEGAGMIRDDAKAAEWFTKAAMGEHADAQYALGELYFHGQGVEADPAEAYVWLFLAMDKDHKQAADELDRLSGQMDSEQWKTAHVRALAMKQKLHDRQVAEWRQEFDRNMAGDWDDEPSDLVLRPNESGGALTPEKLPEDPQAQYEFALTILGSKQPDSRAKAARLFLLSALQGHTKAQVRLGDLYREGNGAVKDLKQAYSWYLLAAEHNDREAQLHLGVMYYEGKVVERNFVKAATFFNKAAEQGLITACINLGLIYEHGFGVSRDRITACMWYYIAGGIRHKRPRLALAGLTSYMPWSEVMEAQKRARKWRKAHPVKME